MIQVTSDSGLENRLPILGMVDMDTGELTTTWDGDLVTHFTHPRFLDDAYIAAAEKPNIGIREAETGILEHTIRSVDEYAFEVDPNNEELVFVSQENLVRWDMETRQELEHYPIPDFYEMEEDEEHRITNLRFDPDLGLLHFSWAIWPSMAEGGPPPGEGTDTRFPNHGRLWDLTSGEEITTGDNPTRPVDFHPDGEALATITQDGDVQILAPETLDVLHTLP